MTKLVRFLSNMIFLRTNRVSQEIQKSFDALDFIDAIFMVIWKQVEVRRNG